MHTTTPPPPPPLPRQAEEKKGDGFLAAVTKSWLPFLTAILVLATAALGLYTKQVADQRDEAQAGSDELEAEKDELQQQIAELEEQKAGLEQELEQAQETPVTTPTPTRGGTAAATDDATPEVLRESGAAPVTIAWNRGIDLDTDAANWDVGSSGDVIYSSGAVSGRLSQFVLVTAPPTPSECAASTLPVGYLPEEQAVVGQQFCVHTDEERWAYVHIAAIDSEARTISFDVTVWKLPTDP